MKRILFLLLALSLCAALLASLVGCSGTEKETNAVPDESETEAETEWDGAVPEELVGMWRGVGNPPAGGYPIDLTVLVNKDGSGEYTFDQDDYHENFKFTVSYEDSKFLVEDIPETSNLSQVTGTWELADGKLLLDVTSVFLSGATYSYTAVCEKD